MFPSSPVSSSSKMRLPLQFIIVGLISFLVANCLFWFYGADVLDHAYRTPTIWGTVHLFIIGWATMIAMGAMYQLIPVALQVKIFSQSLGQIQFFLMLISLIGFVYALISFKTTALSIFGSLLTIGFTLFLLNMYVTLTKVSNWDSMAKLIMSSLLNLTLTMLLGLLLVFQFSTGYLPTHYHLPLLYTHITLGTLGWFTLLIMGFSYKMVPMFSLAHGYTMSLSHPIFSFYHLGLVSIVISYFLDWPALLILGSALLLLAVALFANHIRLILQKGLKKQLDLGFRYALYAIGGALLSYFLFLIWAGLRITPYTLEQINLVPIFYFFFMSWITLSILGYLFKIVPFLWWTYAYSEKIGKENVPTLKEMISENVGKWLFLLFIIGVLLVTAALMIQQPYLFKIGQGLLVIVSFAFLITILSTFKK